MILKYREGNSCTTIAKLLKTSPNTVSKYLKTYGIKIINYQNLLSFKDTDIISDYYNGLSITKICAKYHTSALTIRKKLKNNSIPIINHQNIDKVLYLQMETLVLILKIRNLDNSLNSLYH